MSTRRQIRWAREFYQVLGCHVLECLRLGDGRLKVGSWFACPEDEAKEILDRCGKQETLEKTLWKYKDWAPEMTELLRREDLDTLIQQTLYELLDCRWDHINGFTLIGDAASLQTPFSGEGVNEAMKDSLELADLIERSQDSNQNLTLDEAVIKYEQLMFPRAEKLQATAILNKKAIFGPGAPIAVMTIGLKMVASGSSSIFGKMLGTAPVVGIAYAYFWMVTTIGWAVCKLWRRT